MVFNGFLCFDRIVAEILQKYRVAPVGYVPKFGDVIGADSLSAIQLELKCVRETFFKFRIQLFNGRHVRFCQLVKADTTFIKRFQSNINELKESIDDKEELIAFLREKIRENEMKIKILLNQVHFERNKNEKRANYLLQNSNDKSNMNKTREKSLKN